MRRKLATLLMTWACRLNGGGTMVYASTPELAAVCAGLNLRMVEGRISPEQLRESLEGLVGAR